MATPTNRYFETEGWTFLPNGGTIIALFGITSAAYDEGISTKSEGADFDGFPTVKVCDYREPKITLDTLDAMALYATIAGQKGTLAGILRDAYNGVTVGGGGKTITFTNCQIEGRNFTAAFREFAKQQLVFGGISTDGATHPVAITAL